MLEPARPVFVSRMQHFFALVLVAYFFIFLLTAIDMTDLRFNPTVNRLTYVALPLELVFTLSKPVDHLLALMLSALLLSLSLWKKKIYLAAAPLAICAALTFWAAAVQSPASMWAFAASLPIAVASLYVSSREKRDPIVERKVIARCILYFVVAFEAVALARWVVHVALPTPILIDPTWRIADLETKTFYIIGAACSALLVALVSSYLIRYISDQVLAGRKVLAEIRRLAGQDGHAGPIPIPPRVMLAAAIVASVLLPAYPYMPTVNPDYEPVSVDYGYYTPWMETVLASRNAGEFLENVFVNISAGDRPLSLLAFYSLTAIGMPLGDVLRLMPMILTPALTLSVYHFVRTGSKNLHMAAVVSILVPVSTTVIVGIYAGFYANWIAIIFSFVAFAFLIKYLESRRLRHLLLMLGFLTAVLYAHNYTWSYVVSALVLFTIIYAVMHRKEKPVRLLLLLGLAIASSIAIDAAKTFLLANDSGIDKEYTAVSTQLTAEDFARRWTNLNYVFTVFLGGFYTNVVFYVLALAWIIGAPYRGNNMNLIIMVMIFVGTIAIFAGVYSVQARVIWNMPVYVPAGLILYQLARQPASLEKKMIFIAVVLFLGNYALRSLANLILA